MEVKYNLEQHPTQLLEMGIVPMVIVEESNLSMTPTYF